MSEHRQNSPEYQLYLEFRRKKKIYLIAGIVAAVVGFSTFAILVLPKFLRVSRGEAIPEEVAVEKRVEVAQPMTEASDAPVADGESPKATPAPVASSPTNPEFELSEAAKKRIADLERTAKNKAAKTEEFAPKYDSVNSSGLVDGEKGLDVSSDTRLAPSFQRPIKIEGTRAAKIAKSIDELATRWNKTTSPSERADLVVGGQDTVAKMTEFAKRPNSNDPDFSILLDESFFSIHGYEYSIRTYRSDSGMVFAGFRNVGNDTFKLDWESLVGYSDMAWDDFLATKPTTPTRVRCYLAPTDYYNFEFSDSEKFQSLRLTDRTTHRQIHAFTEKGSEDDKLLNALFERQKRAAPVIVEISFNEGTRAKDCVRFHRLVQETWIVAEQ